MSWETVATWELKQPVDKEKTDWHKKFTEYKIQTDKVVNEMRNDWQEYSFIIRSERQIDGDQIAEDLGPRNSLMIAEIEGSSKVRIYISGQLWTKVQFCKGSKVLKAELDSYYWDGEFGLIERTQLPELIALLKRIKKAQWKRGKTRVCTVRKIKI